jgi:hypothetical protein
LDIRLKTSIASIELSKGAELGAQFLKFKDIIDYHRSPKPYKNAL